jgi:plastocyanin
MARPIRSPRTMLALVALSTLALLGGGAMTGAANAGGGCHSPETQATATGVEHVQVAIQDLCFGPTVMRVSPGATVTWVNRDGFAHVVVGHGYAWGSQGDLQSGQHLNVTFEKAGIYPYSCYLHPGMNGAVVVGGAGVPDEVGDASAVAFAPDPGSGSGSGSAGGSGSAASGAGRAAPAPGAGATAAAPGGTGTLPWRIATFTLAGLLVAGLAVALVGFRRGAVVPG